jgi:hypothetical protein
MPLILRNFTLGMKERGQEPGANLHARLAGHLRAIGKRNFLCAECAAVAASFSFAAKTIADLAVGWDS